MQRTGFTGCFKEEPLRVVFLGSPLTVCEWLEFHCAARGHPKLLIVMQSRILVQQIWRSSRLWFDDTLLNTRSLHEKENDLDIYKRNVCFFFREGGLRTLSRFSYMWVELSNTHVEQIQHVSCRSIADYPSWFLLIHPLTRKQLVLIINTKNVKVKVLFSYFCKNKEFCNNHFANILANIFCFKRFFHVDK